MITRDSYSFFSPFNRGLYSEYVYGFNGMEKDNEVKGTGNSYDFGARMLDVRLGRFLSVDPKTKDYVSYSSYSYAVNNPIRFIEVDGAWPGDANLLILVSNNYSDAKIGITKVGDWTVIKVSSIEQAAQLMEVAEVDKSSFNNIELVAHGGGERNALTIQTPTMMRLGDKQIRGEYLEIENANPKTKFKEPYESEINGLADVFEYAADNANIVISSCGIGGNNIMRKELFTFIDNAMDEKNFSLYMSRSNVTMSVEKQTEFSDLWVPKFNKNRINSATYGGFSKIESNGIESEDHLNLKVSDKNKWWGGQFQFEKIVLKEGVEFDYNHVEDRKTDLERREIAKSRLKK